MIKDDIRLYIQGSYGPANIGDDVLMLICVKLANRYIPAECIAVGVKYPEIAQKWYPGIKWLKKGSFSGLNVDILIYGGGGQFYSFPLTHSKQGFSNYSSKFSRLIAYQIGWRQVLQYLIRHLSRDMSGIPIIQAHHKAAFCVGVGPFVHISQEIERAQKTLAGCDFISVRDPSSKNICDSWGLRNIVVRTDPCFMKDLWSEEADLFATEERKYDSVAFIIRSWPHSKEGQRYYKSIRHAAAVLRARGIKVKFVSLDKESDRPIFRYLKGEDILSWEPAYSKPSDFIMKIAESFNLVVSARAHGIILPATFGIPGICVAIEQKLKNVHRTMPSGTLLWKEAFWSNDLVEMVEYMLVNRKKFVTNILREVAINRAIAMQAVDELSKWLQHVINGKLC